MLTRIAGRAATHCRTSWAAFDRQAQPQFPFQSDFIKHLEPQAKLFEEKVPGMHWLKHLDKRIPRPKVKASEIKVDEEMGIEMGFLEAFAVPMVLFPLLSPLVKKPLT